MEVADSGLVSDKRPYVRIFVSGDTIKVIGPNEYLKAEIGGLCGQVFTPNMTSEVGWELAAHFALPKERRFLCLVFQTLVLAAISAAKDPEGWICQGMKREWGPHLVRVNEDSCHLRLPGSEGESFPIYRVDMDHRWLKYVLNKLRVDKLVDSTAVQRALDAMVEVGVAAVAVKPK